MKTEPEVLYGHVMEWAREAGAESTLQALPYMKEKHSEQYRCGKEKIPYIVHPLTIAWHAILTGIREDELIAVMLLHDICEDCNTCVARLPFPASVQRVVQYLTYSPREGESRNEGKKRYFQTLQTCPEAVLIKLYDRCNNVSTMSDGFDIARIRRYLKETKTYVFPLFPVAEQAFPQYKDALWILKYQMKSVLDMAERLTAKEQKHEKNNII